MYPHERSLVKKMAGRPFVILGVNSDSRDRLKQVVPKEQMTWRSWWDGGNTQGPIAGAWEVQGWPTLVLIDHKGIIRERYLGSPGDDTLDEAVEALVKAAEKKQK